LSNRETLQAGWSGYALRPRSFKIGGSKEGKRQWDELAEKNRKHKENAELRKEKKEKRIAKIREEQGRDK